MARRAEEQNAPRRASLISEDVPECTRCGACCFSDLPEYVRVFGVDWDRMGEEARAFTTFLGNRCYMKMEGGRCAALVLDTRENRFLCAIYEERPDVCRSLERGSGACRGEIHNKRERPLLAMDALVRARR